MSYANFKAKIWSKAIDTELKRLCVYAADCNTQYEGEIKKLGDTVRILGVGKPTITTGTLQGGDIVLSDPEKVADTSVSLVVDHYATFNYAVEDVDAAQGAGNVLSVLNQEASEECANVIDKAIADLSKEAVGVQLLDSNATTLTVDNVLAFFDSLQQVLFENDVAPSTTVTLTIAPWIYSLFRRAYAKLDTDNSMILKNGQVAMYGNMIIRMSNNVAKDGSGNSLVQCKTQRAIALAQSAPHVEPYRPEKGFKDAVKGHVLYGVKIVRPKEMVTGICSPSA